MYTLDLTLDGKKLAFSRDAPERLVIVGDNSDYRIKLHGILDRRVMCAVFARDCREETVLIDEEGCAAIPLWVLKSGGFEVGVISDGFASNPINVRVTGSIIDKRRIPTTSHSPSLLEALIKKVNELTEKAKTDYASLDNKPTLNGVEINGDKTSEDYGIEIPRPMTDEEVEEILSNNL